MSIVWTDSEITVAALIEGIHDLTIYRVRYDKVWRAKKHVLALLWRDWREYYTKVPRLLNVISHFNPCIRCIIDSCGQWLPNKKDRYYLVLKRILWCFPQCVASFAHYRPIISVDATLLTRKYKCTLIIAIDMTVEN
jgi:hypothetical protein